MYGGSKILVGLAAFIILMTFPFWFSFSLGEAGARPELVLPTGQTACVESTEYMRASHMELLNQWRDKVVRGGERTCENTSGQEFEMSLSKTCLQCHTDKAGFCDRCHNYADVSPDCWECHVDRAGD